MDNRPKYVESSNPRPGSGIPDNFVLNKFFKTGGLYSTLSLGLTTIKKNETTFYIKTTFTHNRTNKNLTVLISNFR